MCGVGDAVEGGGQSVKFSSSGRRETTSVSSSSRERFRRQFSRLFSGCVLNWKRCERFHSRALSIRDCGKNTTYLEIAILFIVFAARALILLPFVRRLSVRLSQVGVILKWPKLRIMLRVPQDSNFLMPNSAKFDQDHP